jgi:transposase
MGYARARIDRRSTRVSKAYSMDYRIAVAAAYDECESSADVAQQFGCSESWVRRLIQQRRELGTLQPRSSARHDDQRTYDDDDDDDDDDADADADADADEQTIRELIARKPDATLKEVAQALGKPAHDSTVSRTLGRLKLPRKKSPHTPPSRTGPT